MCDVEHVKDDPLLRFIPEDGTPCQVTNQTIRNNRSPLCELGKRIIMHRVINEQSDPKVRL